MNFIIYTLYLILLALAIRNKKVALFVSIVHMPIVPLVHTSGYIPISNFFPVVLLIHLIFGKSITKVNYNNKCKRALGFLSILALICITGNVIRHAIMVEGVLSSKLSHVLNAVIYAIIIIDIFKLVPLWVSNKEYEKITYKAVVVSGVIIALSVFFTKPLYEIGFPIDEYSYVSNRSSGFFSGGDCNSMSGFLDLVILFIFSKKHWDKQKLGWMDVIILIMLSFCVLLSLSRMGILLLIFVFIYSVVSLQSSRRLFGWVLIISTLTIVLLNSSTLVTNVLERFVENPLKNEFDTDEEGRVSNAVFYLGYMFSSSIDVFLLGSRTAIGELVPHNFYIGIFFYNGFILAILFVVSQIITIVRYSQSYGAKYFLPIAVVVITTLFFLPSGSIMFHFILQYAYMASLISKKLLINREQ